MKSIKHFFTEVEENKAHQKAMTLGLKYKGFGYWVDPTTGKVAYKTEGDELVPVGDKGLDKWEGDTEEDPETPKRGPGGMEIGGGRSASAGSAVLGTADPEQGAKAPVEMDWQAGPDGDNCVDDQEREEVDIDTFVGKTNYPSWQAGPDGSNFTNVREEAEQQQSMGLTDAGYKEKEVTNRAKQRMQNVVGKKPATGRTDREGQEALNKMRANNDQQTVFGNQLASMMKIANRDADRTYDSAPKDQSGKERVERNKEADMWRKVAKLPAIQKDADSVTEMNKVAKGMVSDPDYDLDVDFDDDGYLAEGAFGSVYLRPDGNVVKKGMIGPDELKALHTMRDNPNFPNLINARFDTPFKNFSSEYNNPMNADNERRGPQGYWNPDEASDFDRKFPGAEGTYAMSQANGQELFNAIDNMDEETRDKALRNFWRARGDLHKAGFSHNDMHGGNVFVDPDTGEVNIIDLGLAKDSPISALMEALGGMDYEEGEDYQLSDKVSGAQLPERLRDTFTNNISRVEELLQDKTLKNVTEYDDYDEESDYSPTFTGQSDRIYDMMRGGIRMGKGDLDTLAEDIPYLQDDDNVKGLIKMLYDEVGQSELADRMSDAFEKRQADSDIIRKANKFRAEKGEPEIEVRNPNVVPPRNLDFDD